MTCSAWSTSKPPSKTASAWNVARSSASAGRGSSRSHPRASAGGRGVARSRTGQRQMRREPVADRGRRQQRQPGRGQLDAERQAVEQCADLGHDRQVRAGLPVRPDGPGAIDEQARRGVEVGFDLRSASRAEPAPTPSGRTGYSCSPPTWSGARLVTTNLEPGEARTSAATSPAASSRCSKLSSSEQERPVGRGTPAARRRPVGRRRRTGRGSGRSCDVTSAGSVRPSSATSQAPSGSVVSRRPRELDRQAGLADPAGSGQGHQPVVVEQRIELGELRRTPDEGRQPVGQVAIGRPGDPDRRELGAQPGDVELEQVLRDRDVLEGVPAQVAHADARPAAPIRRATASSPTGRSAPPCPTAAIRAPRLTSKPP